MSGQHRIMGIVLATLLAAGCAAPPNRADQSASYAARDCAQIAADIAASEQSQRTMTDSASNAWKAVLPVAVLVKYASAKHNANDAEKEVEQLRNESAAHGCNSHAG